MELIELKSRRENVQDWPEKELNNSGTCNVCLYKQGEKRIIGQIDPEKDLGN